MSIPGQSIFQIELISVIITFRSFHIFRPAGLQKFSFFIYAYSWWNASSGFSLQSGSKLQSWSYPYWTKLYWSEFETRLLAEKFLFITYLMLKRCILLSLDSNTQCLSCFKGYGDRITAQTFWTNIRFFPYTIFEIVVNGPVRLELCGAVSIYHVGWLFQSCSLLLISIRFVLQLV